MRKLTSVVIAMAVMVSATGAFAAIQPAAPQTNFNGKDYVGKIVAATYDVDAADGQQQILIMTKADKLNESTLSGLTIRISDKDLPYGMTLAGAVGKKIAVLFKDSNYDISSVGIITDEYWNSGDKT